MGVSVKIGAFGNGHNQKKQLVSRKRRNDENLGPSCKLQKKNQEEEQQLGGFVIQKVSKVCHFWSQGKFCWFGDRHCRFLHQWVGKGGISLMRQFNVGGSYAANPVVTGIAHLPSLDGFSQKLISATRDGSLTISDYGDAASGGDSSSFSTTLGVQITCMASQAPWVFLGVPNAVKVWNAKTNSDLTLPAAGPFGLVYSLTVRDGWLMAGHQDGSISTWRLPTRDDLFQPTGCLKGHSLPVISLALGDKFLYSGSMDNTIRVWELETKLCVFTLTGHTAAVTSLICWEHYLLSASLDSTIKVWGRDGTGLNLEVVYTHTQTHGIITFEGYHGSSEKPVLLCSCNDNSLRMYDLPSFKERGKVFCKAEIRAIRACSEQGCIFTGDAAGELRVWKCTTETPKTSSKQ